MSERKVINKYYPIDYDPSKLKRVKKKKEGPQQAKVRIALPMTLTCKNCGNYMSRGSKFNSRKETVVAEAYLGISVYRFYFRCSKCFQELTFKTDPKNGDYVAEHGVTAGYVHFKAGKEAAEAEEAEKQNLEQFDKMKALELRSQESLAEMEVNEAIDTVLMIQAQRAALGAEELHRLALTKLDPTIAYLDDDDDLTAEEIEELKEMQARAEQRRKLEGRGDITNLQPAISGSKAQGDGHIQGEGDVDEPRRQNSGDMDDDEEEEDPIAVRSRLARERLLQMQREQLSLTPTEITSNKSANQGDSNGKDSSQDSNGANLSGTSSNSAPHTSTRPSSAVIGKTMFKVPVAIPNSSSNDASRSPVTISVSNSSSASPSPSTSSSTQTAPKISLMTTKYRRDDDDD